ncbi:nucleolar complex protein 2 homolog [Drosophila guanche]|uniref:Blast:Nucleolar complex protein 2 homolog n=1 Tax=Drosophila guanche TaxID=7266 RepID=A0A3B0JIG7_DROGU|nr:nucleolar complex protein 2 homolog [Drosophila guanche]SPP82157.1 blast:Nucleolar complex protein 2 homolog [Drosophila guanche]
MKVAKKVKSLGKPKAGISKKQPKKEAKTKTVVNKTEKPNDGMEIAKKPKQKPVVATKNVKPPKKGSKKSHKEDLEGLKQIDPEFYEFLKTNDKKLLDFNLMDSDDDDEDEDEKETGAQKDADSDSGDDEENEEKYHKPSDDLAVASDESDFEEDGEGEDEAAAAGGTQKVTLNLLRQWEQQLGQANVSIDIVRKVIQAFNSALASISADGADGGENQPNAAAFKVVGAASFNGVIQLCVLHLQPAIIRVLGVRPNSSLPLHKHKKWVKVRGCLRYYLTDLIRLVEQVSSANILSVLLKHLHQMAGMVAPFTTLGKTILKRLIVLWATGDETVRVLAFLCILKITRNQQGTMLNHVLKAMYLAYVRNSKFVSPNTLPGINFMRRSLVEMFALDLNVSYQHAFLYIRQLAIHLRNAVILKKKDSFQAVYNWQFINSLRLWADLLGASTNKPQLQPLVYPLVTIATGVIRLIPTAQYFPLRFHCLQTLISLSKETQTYVPVLPLIVEVLRSNTFNRKHSAVSMKPLQFTCVLRLNKGQLAENGFRDEVIEQVCALLLEYLAHESASLAFSDLVVPAVMAIKAYLKECRNSNYTRKLKQLLDKIQESSKFIEQQRSKSTVTFDLKDAQAVAAWEQQVRTKRTPLDIYYASWLKTHETKKRRQAAQTDDINSDYAVPKLKRPAAKTGVPVRNENGELELFPSDSEDDEDGPRIPMDDDDDDESELEQPKPKKVKVAKSEKKTTEKVAIPEPTEAEAAVDDYDESGAAVDIVKDLDLDDW